MAKQTYILTKENKEDWPKLKDNFDTIQQALMTAKGGCEITIGEIKKDKSYKQLRGYFRLVNMIIPAVQAQNPEYIIDKDVVDNIIKDRFGYYTQFQEIKTYKSKAKATKEEMKSLITCAEDLGVFFEIKDCYLRSDEERELEEYYNGL